MPGVRALAALTEYHAIGGGDCCHRPCGISESWLKRQ
jgi:hypothetical protein